MGLIYGNNFKSLFGINFDSHSLVSGSGLLTGVYNCLITLPEIIR
jgi:hypothetical protein